MQLIDQSDVVIGGKSGSVEWHNARALELYDQATSAEVQPDVALGLLQESAFCFQGLIEIAPDASLYSDWLAGCEARIGTLLSKLGRTKEAVTWREKSIAGRQPLQRQKWLEPQTTLNLAVCRFELAIDLLKPALNNRRRARAALVKSCRDFKKVLDQGQHESIFVVYFLAAKLLAGLEGDQHPGQGARHVNHALTLCDNQPPNFQNEQIEGLLESLESDRKLTGWLRGALAGLQIGSAYWSPVWMIGFFGSAGAFISPLIQLLLLCTASTWIQQSPSARTKQGVKILLFGLATGLGQAWATGCDAGLLLMSMTAVPALLMVVFFDQLQKRFAAFYRSTSWIARASRRVDRTADEWAAWILRNIPRALHWVLLRRRAGEASVELRWCLAAGQAAASEASGP